MNRHTRVGASIAALAPIAAAALILACAESPYRAHQRARAAADDSPAGHRVSTTAAGPADSAALADARNAVLYKFQEAREAGYRIQLSAPPTAGEAATMRKTYGVRANTAAVLEKKSDTPVQLKNGSELPTLEIEADLSGVTRNEDDEPLADATGARSFDIASAEGSEVPAIDIEKVDSETGAPRMNFALAGNARGSQPGARGATRGGAGARQGTRQPTVARAASGSTSGTQAIRLATNADGNLVLNLEIPQSGVQIQGGGQIGQQTTRGATARGASNRSGQPTATPAATPAAATTPAVIIRR